MRIYQTSTMTISSLFQDPLFSTVITLYVLILLYFPTLFLGIIFSPVFIFTSIVLLSLLRLGATQKKNRIQNPIPAGNLETQNENIIDDDCKRVSSEPSESFDSGLDSDDKPHDPGHFHVEASFVGWDVRAPLEVIHEGYEGEGDDDVLEEESRDAQMAILERYASLSKFYPETDSDASEDEDFPVTGAWDPSGNVGFRWDGEEKDGMIEIALDGKVYSDFDEDNLIEIDLFPPASPAR